MSLFCFKIFNWCDTADTVMFSAAARSHTHTSASNSTNSIRMRVESPNTLKSSARS